MDIFIFLFLYWLYIIPPAAIGVMMYLIRRMAFPLITRNPNELVIILSPGKAKVKKVTAKYHPFFEAGKGVYWFSSNALKTKVKPVTKSVKVTKRIPGQTGKFGLPKVETIPHNKEITYDNLASNTVHIHYDGINQPVHELKRKQNKLEQLFAHSTPFIKQVKGHAVQIPASGLNFLHNYKLTIGGSQLLIEPTNEKQPYKINFFLRIGVYFAAEQKAKEIAAGGQNELATASLEAVTQQSLIEAIGGAIEENINFSSAFAYKIAKKLRYLDRNWVRLVTGGMDMKILMMLITVMAVGALVFLMMMQFQPNFEDLGPMPSN